jgi:hypothetical protein
LKGQSKACFRKWRVQFEEQGNEHSGRNWDIFKAEQSIVHEGGSTFPITKATMYKRSWDICRDKEGIVREENGSLVEEGEAWFKRGRVHLRVKYQGKGVYIVLAVRETMTWARNHEDMSHSITRDNNFLRPKPQ